MLRIVTDKYTTSIYAIKTWQDIWARSFQDLPLRVTLEYLIHSELDWLNKDFKSFISQHGVEVKWVAQEEVWKEIIGTQHTNTHSRLLPLLENSGEPAEDEGGSSSKVSCYCSDLEESSEEVNVVKNELSQLRMSFNAELSQWQLKVKAKEEQLRSANEYLETFSLERENDRLEITKLTQELCKERRLRDTGNSMMDDFRDQTLSLEEQLDQLKRETQDLRSHVLAKDRLIAKQTAEIQELQEELETLKESPDSSAICFNDNQDSIVTIEERNTVSVSTNTEVVQSSSEQPYNLDTADTYTIELVEYIKELHTKLTSKEDQIESLKEDVRQAELWAKAKKPKLRVTAPSLDQEIEMATGPEDPTRLTKPRVKFEDLESKERRIRIAYLENQQAELGTEIKLLKQRGEFEESENDLDPKRMSSGLGESIESNPELDALSRMVVDKVLERISKTGPPIQQPPAPPPSNTVMAVSKVACDDKSSLAVTQMRHLLQRERNLVSELQAAINTERLKALEWMERHNREKECMRELQAEVNDVKDQMEVLHAQHLKDQEEIQQLSNLYKAEQSQAQILETALASEKENFHRLKVALDTERIRSREAIDRDNETILDLRTALEVERERWRAASSQRMGQFLMPSASTGNIPGGFRSLQESSSTHGSRKHLLSNVQMTSDEMSHLRSTIDQLRNELGEERNRVDALKSCLQQEREKYNKLSVDLQQPQSIIQSAQKPDETGQKSPRLDQEVIVYYARKLETEQLQKMQLQNQIDRALDQISRLESDKEFLRTQLKRQDAPNANFEKFYVEELEKKLEAHRNHESKIMDDLQVAQTLVKDLQEENKNFLTREKEMVNQLERLQDQKIAAIPPLDPANDSPSKVSHLSAINEALQGKIRLLENRIARLQDDVETNNLVNANTNNGMTAIMMSRPKKSRDSKPPMKLRLWRLERQKKCLVWQKKYLQAVLQNMEETTNNSEQCKNTCNCITSSSESHSLLSNNSLGHSNNRKRLSFRIAAYTVIAALRLQGNAETWKKMVSKSGSISKSVTPVSDK